MAYDVLPDAFSEREIEVIECIRDDLTNAQIAGKLFLAHSTVKWYIRQLNSKLMTSSRDEIVEKALTLGLLNSDHPPSLSRTQLPRQNTPFIGRETELEEISALLQKDEVRLITILGPGGMGKTRLALEAAEQQIGNFRDGVYFVELGSLGSFDEQLIASIYHFVYMLRSGYNILQSFEIISQRAPEPTASAVWRMVEDVKGGASFFEAMTSLKDRTGSRYFDMIIETLEVQFRDGGNLADRLDAVVEQIRSEVGGTHWDDKADYAERLIIIAIARAFELSLPPGASLSMEKQFILRQLADKNSLLLIDNWEHLLDGASLVNDLLREAPGLRILATSREKLKLSNEMVFPLTGMQLPEWERPDEALEYDAVKLLVSAAQRIQPGFTVNQGNLQSIAKICHLSAGMPLGILLAMAWLDMLTLDEIATEIQHSLDFLNTDLRDIPERHRSIYAVFNYAWDRLSEDERSLFMKLSVFRGGFSAQAATRVSGARLPQLHKLVEKGLLYRDREGRFSLHELLRQYAEQMLNQSALLQETRTAHMDCSADLLHDELRSVFAGELNKIKDNEDNIITAWQWAVQTRNPDFFEKALETLLRYYLFRPQPFLMSMLTEAAAALKPVHESAAIYAKIICEMGTLTGFDGVEVSRGRRLLEEGLVLAQTYGHLAVEADALAVLSLIISRDALESDLHTAAEMAKRACDILESLPDTSPAYDLSFALGTLGSIYLRNWHRYGDLGYAYKQRAYELALANGDVIAILDLTYSLAKYHHYIGGDVERSLEFSTRALEIARHHKAEINLELFSLGLAFFRIMLGHYDEAAELLDESIYWRKRRLVQTRTINPDRLRALLLLLQDQPEDARRIIQQSPYEIAMPRVLDEALLACHDRRFGEVIGHVQMMIKGNRNASHYDYQNSFTAGGLMCTALCLPHLGQIERAVQLMGLVQSSHLAFRRLPESRIYVHWLEHCHTALSEQDFKRAWNTGRTLDFKTEIMAILENRAPTS